MHTAPVTNPPAVPCFACLAQCVTRLQDDAAVRQDCAGGEGGGGAAAKDGQGAAGGERGDRGASVGKLYWFWISLKPLYSCHVTFYYSRATMSCLGTPGLCLPGLACCPEEVEPHALMHSKHPANC